ncbi:MAG: hypothetical protein DI626_06230 [Micavibrio aeruginosavorus]|uniref:Glycosyltransferase 2-like domain-containing protein n=1 Tax=Micavibrio aeruginosavorus TaxID=349221 RepID=A0A2W4ZZZ9_9BACT|nr:MAG: hypothetical protein DI626_06230 [Micavibrio aeruginosavorus]
MTLETTTKQNPFLSIITVTKDNLNGLKRTAQSIRMQSVQDYEWIVVDALSADGSESYLHTDIPHVHIREADDGIYDAMNKGIRAASGRYLLFLNAGDCLSDMDIIATIMRAAADNPDYIYGDALETNGLFKKAQSLHSIDWGMPTHHQAMIYRKGLLPDLLYDTRYRIAADYDYTRRFLKAVKNTHYIPAALCVFENGGLSETRRKEARREQYDIRKNCGVPALKNRLIYVAQGMTAFMRERFPSVYFPARRCFSAYLTRA